MASIRSLGNSQGRREHREGRRMTFINCVDYGNAVLIETPRFPASRRAGYDEHTALRPCGVSCRIAGASFRCFSEPSASTVIIVLEGSS
jgi:hypothetical protein